MRLYARYKHFYAKGKVYQHFWANSGDGIVAGQTLTAAASITSGAASGNASASGALLSIGASLIAGNASGNGTAFGGTITVNGSIISGAPSSDNNLDGEVLSVSVSLIPGSTSQDASAPLNTRLNARYRHFWNRRQRWRHFWAQWEGDGISGALADGDLVIASLAIVLNGSVFGDANQDGDTPTATASIISGEAIGEAGADGDLYVVTASLPDGQAFGQTLPVAAYLPDGQAWGADLESAAEIIGGEAIVPPNVLATTGELLVAYASLLQGTAQSGVFVDGELITVDASLPDAQAFAVELDVQASIIEGAAESEAYLDGQEIEVSVSLLAGVASVQAEEEQVAGIMRGMPPAFRHGKGRDNAEAFGDIVEVGVSLLAGVASVEHQHPVAAFAKELPAARVSQQGFAPIVIAPAQFSIPREVPGAFVQVGLSLLPGIASADASASGAIIEDWLPNDERDLADLASLAA